MAAVTVKLFGTLRLDSGVKVFTAEADRVRDLYPAILAEIRRRKPESRLTEKELHSCLAAVNGQQANLRTKLRDGDEVYFFPAVAGG